MVFLPKTWSDECGRVNTREIAMPTVRVTLLTNFVPPYRAPMCRVLKGRLRDFRVLLSTPMEPNRPWRVEHEGLDVEIQKTLTLLRSERHPHGFREHVSMHFPYDTLFRLSRLKPDVVISAELGARTTQALIYRHLHPSSRLVIWVPLSEHTESGRDWLRRFVRRRILPHADAVVVNGASGARYMRAYGVPAGKIFVVPQTTSVSQFSAVSLERNVDEGRRLIYVGQLVERKGLTQFLSALSRWCETHPSDDVEFWLVGDGPQRAKLEDAPLPPNLELHFLGNVSYGDLPALYGRAGIFAFPTLADAWGLVVNEAMTAGLPVLGSVYSQAVEDIVEDGRTGWTFRPDCAEEMYAALDRALTTPQNELRRMGMGARRAAEHLTPELAANGIMNAIRFAIDGVRG